MPDDLIQLHEWEDARNMELEHQECECDDPECEGVCDDPENCECEELGDLIAESHGFNMWRQV